MTDDLNNTSNKEDRFGKVSQQGNISNNSDYAESLQDKRGIDEVTLMRMTSLNHLPMSLR